LAAEQGTARDGADVNNRLYVMKLDSDANGETTMIGTTGCPVAGNRSRELFSLSSFLVASFCLITFSSRLRRRPGIVGASDHQLQQTVGCSAFPGGAGRARERDRDIIPPDSWSNFARG
jgi:hypothetical protein